MHPNEKEVAKAIKLEKNTPERKKLLTKLRLLGDYHHNQTVTQTGEGQFIVVRRPGPKESCTAQDFLPCVHCSGYIRRNDLWKHQGSCEFKPRDKDGNQKKYRKVQLESEVMVIDSILKGKSSSLSRTLASMKRDDITDIVKNDDLIIRFGTMLVDKLGSKNSQLISQKMRELARLVQQLKQENADEDLQLSTFFKPEKV